MDRYSEYARDLRKIPNVESFSSRATILPLREFPQKCDPRRDPSYRKNQDIERSREDQPLLTIVTDPYKLRRIVVPPTRSQYIEPSRIPNARDPRGLRACRKFNARSKKWKYVPNWVPTLIENDLILQEEETCAVLAIDVSKWESRGIKRSYIEIIPHECNVQRSLAETERQLAELEVPREDEMLMTPEEAREAEENMQTTARNDRGAQDDDSDIEECDSDGEVLLPREAPPAFDTVEDRPMLEINEEESTAGPSTEKPLRPPRRIDEDEDEDRVIYEADEPEERPVPRLDDDNVECIEIDAEQPNIKKEPQEPPTTPRSDDADVVCVNLDSDEEEEPAVVPNEVPKKEPQEPPPPPVPRSDDANVECINLDSDEEDSIVSKEEAPPREVPFDKNLPREVLGEIIISDSDDDDWDLMQVAMQLSMDESETNRSKYDNSQPTCSGAAGSSSPIDAKEDLLEQSAGFRTGESNTDYGEQVTEADHNSSNEHCVNQRPEMPLRNGIGRCIQNSDCDNDNTIESDIFSDTVIGESRPVENRVASEAMEKTAEDSVGFGAKVPETWDIADEADRSSDSDNDVPTSMQLETLADVHEEPCIRDKADDDDVIAHSEISQMQQETVEETNVAAANICAQKRKRIDSERLDAYVNELMHASAVVDVDIKRRKENNDDAANDENQSDNCKALVVRSPSPVFKGLPRRRNKRAKKKPSKNVLQLSSTSTCAISKPSARNHHLSIVLSNFSALGILKDYLKNYTATYTSLNFFSKGFEKLSFFEFLRVDEYVKRNNDFWKNRNNHWHREGNNVVIEDVTEGNQLAIEPARVFMNSQVCENNQSGEQKTVIEEAATTSQSGRSCSTTEGVTTVMNSCLVQGNSEDDTGKIKSQRRHLLPLATAPQQSSGVKKPRSGSNNNSLKIRFKRSLADDNNWIATASTSPMPKISVQSILSNSNNSTLNALEQSIPNKHVDSVTNDTCVFVNKVLPKWFCIDKEVPELDLDDLVNRPLPQKIQFDKSKLSLSLQSRIKRRSTSVDSAIFSDYDENVCKRMKLTESANEYEQTINIYNDDDDDDEFSYHDNIGESLEITDSPPDSATELSKPQSENVCNLNNNNNEDTFINSEKQMSSDLEILPKNCPSNTVVLDQQEGLNLNEKNAPCLENINQDLQDDASFASDSSFHLRMEDELNDPPSTAQSQDSNIQIDHNCNLHKYVNSFEEPCNKTLNTEQNKTNLSENLEKQANLNNLYAKEVDRLNKKIETLFGESNINEVEKMVAKKYNYKKYQTNELRHMQKDGQTDNSVETKLQSIEEKQSTANTVEQSCVKDLQLPAPNSTESVLMTTITTNEKQQQQQIFGEKVAGTDATHEKEDHIDILLSNEKRLALESGLMTIITTNEEQQQQQIFCEKDAGTEATHEKEDHNEISMNNEKEWVLESGCMTTIITSEDQQQQMFGEKYAGTDVTHEKDDHIIISLSNKKELALEIASLENQDKIIISESSTTSDLQSDSSKNVDQHEDCSDVQNSQALINNEKQLESDNALEFESDLSKDNQNSVILNEKKDSDVSHCNINDNVTSEHPSSKDEEMVENEKSQQNSNDSSENEEICNINAPNSPSNQDQGHLEMIGLEDGLEEGDLDFHTSIHGFKTNSKYSDDDYDVNSDDEYKNQATVEYLKDDSVQKSSESLVSNKDTDASDCVSNTFEKDGKSSTIKTERSSTISEDEHLHSSQKSPLKITNADATKSNWNNFIDIDEEDDDIIIEYENVNNDFNHSKDVKPDISNINGDLSVQISETSDLQVPNVDITLESQPTVQKVVSPALLAESDVHDKDSSVEPVQLQTETNTETMDSLDKSDTDVGIPVPDNGFRPSSTLNNSSTSPSAIEVPVSSEYNDQVSSPSISVNSTFAVEPTIQSNANIALDFNNQNILEKFNLTREIIAPEDVERNTENPVAFENNDEEQTLCNILENMLKEDSGREHDTLKVTNEQKNSSVVVPSSASSLVFKVSLLTGPQSKCNDELFKALNVNVVDDVDVIVDKTVDKNSAKQGSPEVIKVKNLNDLLQSVSNPSTENTTSRQQDFPRNTLPNVPVNMFPPPPNNPIPNAYIIQPPLPPHVYTVSQPMPGGVQPSIPIINNIGQQVHFPNAGLVNQVPMQNNVQIPAAPPPAVILDNPIVLASSIFTNMFDKRETVFSLPLPPLPNVILPPPYTILPSHNNDTIGHKIEAYKSKLLYKIIETLRQLEQIDINTIKRQLFKVLRPRQTLTAETWNIQEKMLIIAQCVGSFKKLTTKKNYSTILKAIRESIRLYVRDINLLEKIFGIFQSFKDSGIFRSDADEQQPLALELGVELRQTAIGMSSTQKEVLKYQLRIYDEMLKINRNQIQSIRVAQPNIQMKNQNPVQRSSPMALQQNIVTTTVSSPVTDIANNSFQNSANIQHVQSVSTKSLPGTAKEQHGNEKQNPSIQKAIYKRAFANECDISNICLRCGKQGRIKCERCSTAMYCTSDCQTMHWNAKHCTSCKTVNSAF